MTSTNPNLVVQRGRPSDPYPAISRAHQQPRTDVTDATRGEPQQPRTGVLHANRGKETIAKKSSFNICTYNTRTINDLHDDALDVMLQELSNVNWDVIGLPKLRRKNLKSNNSKNLEIDCCFLEMRFLYLMELLAFSSRNNCCKLWKITIQYQTYMLF